MRVVALLICLLCVSCALPTCEEQEAQLRTLLPDTQIDLEGIPSEVAADIVKGFVAVQAQYPYAMHRLGRIAEEQRFDLLYANTLMRTLYPTNSIYFNGRRMQSTLSIERQYGLDVGRGWHVKTSFPAATAITVHELGHCLTANWRLMDDEDIIRIWQQYREAAEKGEVLSRSAALNIHEFLAESFVDIVLNGQNMSKPAWKVKIIIDNL